MVRFYAELPPRYARPYYFEALSFFIRIGDCQSIGRIEDFIVVVVVDPQNGSKERHLVSEPGEIFDDLLDWRSIDYNGETIGAKLVRINLGFSPVLGSNDSRINIIGSATMALDLLPIALKLLFEDCIQSYVRFLEAVPWTDEQAV